MKERHINDINEKLMKSDKEVKKIVTLACLGCYLFTLVHMFTTADGISVLYNLQLIFMFHCQKAFI